MSMQRTLSGLRNKLMAGCALVAACVLATPAALAGDGYSRHGDSHDADVFGALVVGALIGGVLVAATDHHRDYGYYYPARAYAPAPYYGGPYYGAPYDGGSYYRPAAYGYGNAYPRYGYGPSVNIDIRATGHRGYYDHGWHAPQKVYRAPVRATYYHGRSAYRVQNGGAYPQVHGSYYAQERR